jgi:hypothetical protein
MDQEQIPKSEITYAISRTGTRHIVGFPAGRGPIKLHAGRISTLCDFGIHPDEVLEVALRDCQFCLGELELIRRLEKKQAEIHEQKLKAAAAIEPGAA